MWTESSPVGASFCDYDDGAIYPDAHDVVLLAESRICAVVQQERAEAPDSRLDLFSCLRMLSYGAWQG